MHLEKKLNHDTPFEIVEICKLKKRTLKLHLLNPCFIRANPWLYCFLFKPCAASSIQVYLFWLQNFAKKHNVADL